MKSTFALYILLLTTAFLLSFCEAHDCNISVENCFSSNEIAASVIVTPLLLSLVGGIIVVGIILCIKRKKLMEIFSSWRKRRSGQLSRGNMNNMDNPTYSSNVIPTSQPLPTSPTSHQLPFYESVDMVLENHADGPDYDAVDGLISELTTSLRNQPPSKRFIVQRCNSDTKSITAYAVTTVADEIPEIPEIAEVAEQEVEVPNGIVSQKVKEINMLTHPPAQEHKSTVDTDPVAENTVARPATKPVCPPKPNISLLNKYGLKKSSSCSGPSKYSELNPLASYASLEPHMENREKGLTPNNTPIPTKNDYSHLVH